MSYIIDKNPINDIINGNMDIWQRGTSFTGIATNTYCADRFLNSFVGTMVYDITRSTDVPNKNYNYSLKLDVTTADAAIAAGDLTRITTKVEGFNYKKYVNNYGTFGFWVKAVKTGIYCISFRNSGLNRSYVTEFEIYTTNTWEYKSVTVLFNETGGTWDYINGVGLDISIVLASGSTFQTTANAWQTGNFLATSNIVNGVDNTANDFYLTGLTFNVGNQVYSNFSYDISNEHLRCLRYFRNITNITNRNYGLGYAFSTSQVRYVVSLTVPLRANPTITLSASKMTDISAGATVNVSLNTVDGAALEQNIISFNWNDAATPFTATLSYGFFMTGSDSLKFEAEL